MTLKTFFYQNLSIIILSFATLYPQKALTSDCGGPVIQVGWFTATQGKSQHVDIDGLIGDDFSVSKSSDQNILVGIGYHFDGCDICQTSILYGINAFYLAPTTVSGKVTQEDIFTNLSYHYSRTNYPIYFDVKALIHFNELHDLVIDIGIGPNFVHTSGFKERSLDGGITIPDKHVFSATNSVAFSATLGLGWRINEVFNNLSLEIDYRFFYLGEGRLKKHNSQIKNSLHTGNSYANALILSISL